MQFSFANPGLLWCLPLALLPVVFHLFFRLRKQVQPFPSLMFFMRIDPKLSAKRKIHEWLILLLRCLIIALVLLALARPSTNVGAGSAIARLILIDNSASMGGTAEKESSKFVLATRTAEKFLSQAKPGDATAIQLMVPDFTSSLPQGFNADSTAVKDALRKLTPTDGKASVNRSIRAAIATLSVAKQPIRELHIITDLSKSDWNQGELEFDAQANKPRIVIHRIDTPTRNSGYATITPQQTPKLSVPAGRIIPVRLEAQNHGKSNALVRINTIDDSGKNTSRDLTVPPGEKIPVTLTFSFPSAGFHWAQAWLDGDAAYSGSRISLGFWNVKSLKSVYLGSRERFAALPLAIAPGGSTDLSGIESSFVTPDKLSAVLAEKPVSVSLLWEYLPNDPLLDEALQKYLKEGGILWIVPTPEIGFTSSATIPQWLKITLDPQKSLQQAESIMALQAGEEIWENLRDPDGKIKLPALRLFRSRPLKAGQDWSPLMASSGGDTILAERKFGKGKIYASGISFIPSWSSLPLRAGFVVMIQNALFSDKTETLPIEHLEAGLDIRFESPNQSARVQALSETQLDWQGEPSKFSGLARSGIYEIRQKDRSKWLAVSTSAEEAGNDYFTTSTIPLFKNIQHEIVSLGDAEDIARDEFVKQVGSMLYGWILVLTLLIVLLESWLSNIRSNTLGRKLVSSAVASLFRKNAREGRAT